MPKRTARGSIAKEASGTLMISSKTVETYRARAMVKLGFKRHDDLMRFAAAEGWILPV